MKVSGFTFLRNGQRLGYPFFASIRSLLPLVDEFIIALGPCDDDTEKMLRASRHWRLKRWLNSNLSGMRFTGWNINSRTFLKS
jgi:hypothetical protein